MIVLPIAAGIVIGRIVDSALDTEPYATIVLLAAGIGLALIEAFRIMSEALKLIRYE